MQNAVFFNRDISWLHFNAQVLAEAGKDSVPLLERVKFLSIYSSNLDEFYRVRIPAIRSLQRIERNEDGDVYQKVNEVVAKQLSEYGRILNTQVIPLLEENGIHFLYNKAIPSTLHKVVTQYFFTQVAGLLKPVLLDGKVNFFPENNQLYIAVIAEEDKQEALYLVNVPCDIIPRFFKSQEPDGLYIIFLEDVICYCLPHVFAGKQIEGTYNIKITRDAELDLEDEYSEDLAEKIERQLSKRDQGYATRFLYEPGIPLRHLYSIADTFHLQSASVMEGGKHHNLKDLIALPVDDSSLMYEPRTALEAITVGEKQTLFDCIVAKDRMVHPPYQSYDTVLRFFNEAVIDNTVEEIHTTLYRVASDSKIVQALISAASNGKKVFVLVELKARFDEANNIRWAKKMKAAGVKIVYSSKLLKVHAKVALVKRKHATHPYLGLLATGNLNESTARFYTDHILLTAHQEMMKEVEMLFAFLAKHKNPDVSDDLHFNHLLVPPFNLQSTFLQLIDREINNARNGLHASIIIKMNNLEEEVLINKLYEASNSGVRIQLIVRSICRLVPGLEGQSANISVKRIVDRYLEHGRVFIFHNNGDEQVFMGSADWMNRNIYHRIEVCFPVYNKQLCDQLKHIVSLQLEDNTQSVYLGRELESIGRNNDEKQVRSQRQIYDYLKGGKELNANESYEVQQ